MADILLLDDSTELLEMFQVIFKMNGHDARTTDSIELFMQELHKNKPDLILLDVNLREIDGRLLCKELKGNEDTKQIPVILISASPNKLQFYKEYNADEFLEKPFDLKTLRDKVNHLLSR